MATDDKEPTETADPAPPAERGVAAVTEAGRDVAAEQAGRSRRTTAAAVGAAGVAAAGAAAYILTQDDDDPAAAPDTDPTADPNADASGDPAGAAPDAGAAAAPSMDAFDEVGAAPVARSNGGDGGGRMSGGTASRSATARPTARSTDDDDDPIPGVARAAGRPMPTGRVGSPSLVEDDDDIVMPMTSRAVSAPADDAPAPAGDATAPVADDRSTAPATDPSEDPSADPTTGAATGYQDDPSVPDERAIPAQAADDPTTGSGAPAADPTADDDPVGTTAPPPAPTGPIDTIEEFQAAMHARIAAWDPPEGSDPDRAEALRTDLQHLIDRSEPAPGESFEDAVNAFNMEMRDQLEQFQNAETIDDMRDANREQADAFKAQQARAAGIASETDAREAAYETASNQFDDYKAGVNAFIDGFSPPWGEGFSSEDEIAFKSGLRRFVENQGLKQTDINNVYGEQQDLRQAVVEQMEQFRNDSYRRARDAELLRNKINATDPKYIPEGEALIQARFEQFMAEPIVPPDVSSALDAHLAQPGANLYDYPDLSPTKAYEARQQVALDASNAAWEEQQTAERYGPPGPDRDLIIEREMRNDPYGDSGQPDADGDGVPDDIDTPEAQAELDAAWARQNQRMAEAFQQEQDLTEKYGPPGPDRDLILAREASRGAVIPGAVQGIPGLTPMQTDSDGDGVADYIDSPEVQAAYDAAMARQNERMEQAKAAQPTAGDPAPDATNPDDTPVADPDGAPATNPDGTPVTAAPDAMDDDDPVTGGAPTPTAPTASTAPADDAPPASATGTPPPVDDDDDDITGTSAVNADVQAQTAPAPAPAPAVDADPDPAPVTTAPPDDDTDDDVDTASSAVPPPDDGLDDPTPPPDDFMPPADDGPDDDGPDDMDDEGI